MYPPRDIPGSGTSLSVRLRGSELTSGSGWVDGAHLVPQKKVLRRHQPNSFCSATDIVTVSQANGCHYQYNTPPVATTPYIYFGLDVCMSSQHIQQSMDKDGRLPILLVMRLTGETKSLSPFAPVNLVS